MKLKQNSFKTVLKLLRFGFFRYAGRHAIYAKVLVSTRKVVNFVRPSKDLYSECIETLYRKNCIQSIQCCISRRSKTAKIKCYKL